jgi:hypothetical protein
LGQGTQSTPRIRRHGGGRKRRTEEDPGLRPALEQLLLGDGAGQTPNFRWSCENTASLVAKLAHQGHSVSPRTAGRLLRDAGYRLDGNRPRSQRLGDAGRRVQFVHVARTTELLIDRGQPVIAVSFRSHTPRTGGRRPQDRSYEAAARREKCLARFAAQAVVSWWGEAGSTRIPSAEELFLVVDGCGCDANRRRACRAAFSALPARLGSRSRSAIFRQASFAGPARSAGPTRRPLEPAGAARRTDTRSSSGCWSPDGRARPRAVSFRTRRQMSSRGIVRPRPSIRRDCHSRTIGITGSSRRKSEIGQLDSTPSAHRSCHPGVTCGAVGGSKSGPCPLPFEHDKGPCHS